MEFSVVTHYPIALNSLDHKFPRGTAHDNSVNRAFNKKLYAMYPDCQVSVLDLGCAGGGMVESFLDDGHTAVGLEGSDYSLIHQRAAWKHNTGNLFTCDCAKSFKVLCDNEPYQFDVITAWEFIEHIKEIDLPVVIANMRKHLKKKGLVIGSSTDKHALYQGVDHHKTCRSLAWWVKYFEKLNFKYRQDIKDYFDKDFVRRSHFNFVFQKVGDE